MTGCTLLCYWWRCTSNGFILTRLKQEAGKLEHRCTCHVERARLWGVRAIGHRCTCHVERVGLWHRCTCHVERVGLWHRCTCHVERVGLWHRCTCHVERVGLWHRCTCHVERVGLWGGRVQIRTKETAARIVLEDDIFRAMTHQVQYMAIHCTLKWKNSIYVQTLDKTCIRLSVSIEMFLSVGYLHAVQWCSIGSRNLLDDETSWIPDGREL